MGCRPQDAGAACGGLSEAQPCQCANFPTSPLPAQCSRAQFLVMAWYPLTEGIVYWQLPEASAPVAAVAPAGPS